MWPTFSQPPLGFAGMADRSASRTGGVAFHEHPSMYWPLRGGRYSVHPSYLAPVGDEAHRSREIARLVAVAPGDCARIGQAMEGVLDDGPRYAGDGTKGADCAGAALAG